MDGSAAPSSSNVSGQPDAAENRPGHPQMPGELPSGPSSAGRSSQPATFVEDVEIVGHIIDSLILPKVLDEIMALGGRFEIREVRIGQRRNDASYALLRII